MSLSTLLKSVFVINIVFHENILPSHSFERVRNVVRPPQDRRQYRGLKLKNGMKVMLISDELTDTSAASLVIGVGAFNDHENIPGLVNLVGHVLLTGGGDNPANFERFIESHKGAILAPDTRENEQSFSFRVPHTHFGVALREFAQIFINPRLMYDSNPNIIKKAVQSLQREFSANARDDDERVAEVEKLWSGDSYFINHLYCGSENTFYNTKKIKDKKKSNDERNAGLMKIVKIFFELWYSSHLMTLAVLGREPLEDLEDMVVSLFENITNNYKQKVTYPVGVHPWRTEELMQRLCIVPLKPDVRTIVLTFPVPDFREHYDAAPENYVMHYILYAGHNTLVSVLRKRDLCTSVEFSYLPFASFAFVKIRLKVTQHGVLAVDDIINLIFQYIYMLKDDGVEAWMQKQLRMSYIRAFKQYNATPPEPLDYTMKIARNLQMIREIGDVLHEEFFRRKWDPVAIRRFLSFLRPNNLNITLVSQLCSIFGVKLLQEKHYKTLYTMTRISNEMLTRWCLKESHPPLELPQPNDLMPEIWEIFTRDDHEPWEPHIIHGSPISEIWFMQENTSTPEVFIHLEFSSSVVNLGVVERTLWRLFYDLLKNFLDDHVVHLPQFEERKWINYDLFTNDRGMQMKFHGANDKLHLLLERVFSRMTTDFVDYISEDNFNDVFRKYLHLLKKEIRQSHSSQLDLCILQYRKYDDDWQTESVLTLEGKLKVDDLKQFLRKVFRRIFIRGLIYGNYTKQKALDVIVNTIEKSFSSSHGLLLQEIMRIRLVDLGDSSHHFYQLFNKECDFYGNSHLLQLGSNEPSPRETVLSYLLEIILLEQCQKFFINITENQSLSPPQTACRVVQMFPVRSLSIKVLSNETPQNVDSNLKKFLHDAIPKIITEQPIDDFLTFKHHLEGFFKPTSLQSISNEYWREILNRSYQFDRGQIEVDELRAVKKLDLLKFVKKNLLESSRQRRVFTAHILPKFPKNKKNRKIVSYTPAGATKIEDMSSYKASMTLLPCEFKSSRIGAP